MNIDTKKLNQVFSSRALTPDCAQSQIEWNGLVTEFVMNAANVFENKGDFVVFMRKMQEIKAIGNQSIANQSNGAELRQVFVDDES